MDDLRSKKCRCGETMGEIIGYDDNEKPFRQGWYCVHCRAWEQAILRERTVVRQNPAQKCV